MSLCDLRIHLRDNNHQMTVAWHDFFDGIANVQISEGDIFGAGCAADAILSPANSFGFMDGGIDMAYSRHFGWQLQHRLQRQIRAEPHFGELHVGQALIIPAYPQGVEDMAYLQTQTPPWPLPEAPHDESIRWLVSAPTMRIPERIPKTCNAYVAFRAALVAIRLHNQRALAGGRPQDVIRSLITCGLGTAVGQMPFRLASYQMRKAYDSVVLNEGVACFPGHLGDAIVEHTVMLGETVQRYQPDGTSEPFSALGDEDSGIPLEKSPPPPDDPQYQHFLEPIRPMVSVPPAGDFEARRPDVQAEYAGARSTPAVGMSELHVPTAHPPSASPNHHHQSASQHHQSAPPSQRHQPASHRHQSAPPRSKQDDKPKGGREGRSEEGRSTGPEPAEGGEPLRTAGPEAAPGGGGE
ncbi:putative Appr-1-p processing protein [Paratrimastix pyriformis]|uniref:Appr-1-p processing protein n=1 Tax=Paratrimastix pyriformis TaxID=342808 RepID=A0ABQ8UHE7_9EUKA|nr:putative Appr-1-p processing protein [Paratrimastix pyriformis]